MGIEDLNRLGGAILDASIEVHKFLGPGFLESVYSECLLKEFEQRGIHVDRETRIPLSYKGIPTGKNYYIDILVEMEIIIEVKAVATLLPIHSAQLLSYLRITNKQLGYLINFNTTRLMDGFKRIVNKLY